MDFNKEMTTKWSSSVAVKFLAERYLKLTREIKDGSLQLLNELKDIWITQTKSDIYKESCLRFQTLIVTGS